MQVASMQVEKSACPAKSHSEAKLMSENNSMCLKWNERCSVKVNQPELQVRTRVTSSLVPSPPQLSSPYTVQVGGKRVIVIAELWTGLDYGLSFGLRHNKEVIKLTHKLYTHTVVWKPSLTRAKVEQGTGSQS